MKQLFKFFISPFYQKYRSLYDRITALETVTRELLNDPPLKRSADSGFNGQLKRKEVFSQILAAQKFDAVLETGTWIGNSTGYLAESTGLPVHTCELNDLYQAAAKRRLCSASTISYYLCDSREFLRQVAGLTSFNKPFIYLDAHWYKDLPLAEEIRLIHQNWREFLILIDDFQVPGDPGYGYDQYGRGKELTISCFKDVILAARLNVYFPNIPSADETGAKRGYVFLAPEGAISQSLDAINTLSRWRA